MPNFRRHLSSAFFLTNCCLERISNSVDPDEMSHLDVCYLQKPIIVACGSERVKSSPYFGSDYRHIFKMFPGCA